MWFVSIVHVGVNEVCGDGCVGVWVGGGGVGVCSGLLGCA